MASAVQRPPATVNLELPRSPTKPDNQAFWYIIGFAAAAAAVVATMGLISYVVSGLSSL